MLGLLLWDNLSSPTVEEEVTGKRAESMFWNLPGKVWVFNSQLYQMGPKTQRSTTELILLQISWTPNICRLLAWEKMQSGDLLRDSSLGLLYKLWSQTDLSSDSGPTIWKLYKLGQDIELLRDSIPLFSNWG